MQRLPRRATVGRVLRVGNRELVQGPVGKRVGDAAQLRIDCDRRSPRDDQRKPAHRIDDARIDAVPLAREGVDVRLVGREEQLERGAILDLATEIPRRAEHQPELPAGLLRELRGDVRQRELEVRGRRDDGNLRRRRSPRTGQRRDGEQPCDERAAQRLSQRCGHSSYLIIYNELRTIAQ